MPVDDDFDVDVLDSDDEKLKILGELFSNKTSREIIRHLMTNEMYVNEIALKLDLRVSLVLHHLKKLKQLGLVEVNKKKLIRKGVDHNFYKMKPFMFLAPNNSKEELEEKGILKRIFKPGVKFALIFMAALFTSILYPSNNFAFEDSPNIDKLQTILPFLVFILGLIIERFSVIKKIKRVISEKS